MALEALIEQTRDQLMEVSTQLADARNDLESAQKKVVRLQREEYSLRSALDALEGKVSVPAPVKSEPPYQPGVIRMAPEVPEAPPDFAPVAPQPSIREVRALTRAEIAEMSPADVGWHMDNNFDNYMKALSAPTGLSSVGTK